MRNLWREWWPLVMGVLQGLALGGVVISFAEPSRIEAHQQWQQPVMVECPQQ